MDIFNFWNIVIPTVGITCVIIIGALAWAMGKIKEFIGNDYVTKDECVECSSVVRRELHNEILEVQKKTNKMDEMLIRIDTKVDLLLNGKIKKGD